MKILKLKQGEQAWHEHRSTARNASDAPAMMGQSPYKTRSALVAERATGVKPEINAATQALFDDGHAAEAAARPIAEKIIGDELFPVIGQSDDGYLSASFDGRTMDGLVTWEHKLWNAEKAEQINNGVLPPCDYWQVVHQFATSDAERTLYMVSDGTEENMAYLFVERNSLPDGDIEHLRAGWAQFDEDVKNWQPPEGDEAKAVAAPVDDLPAVRVQVSGELTIRDNFEAFGRQLNHFLESILIREPETDQDFADLEAQIKTLKKAEDALDTAEGQLLSQVEAVDVAKRQKDQLHKLTRDNRLMAEKLVKDRKKEIKVNIAWQAKADIEKHVKTINDGLPDGYNLPAPAFDIGGAMKGKRTIATLREAANNEVNRAKIDASTSADKLRANVKTIADAGHDHLFADRQTLALKEPDDLATTIKLRIHEEAERQRQQEQAAKEKAEREAREAAERERERIRQEEQAKARVEAKGQPNTPECGTADAPANATPAPVGDKDASTSPTATRIRSLNGELQAWRERYQVTDEAYAALLAILNQREVLEAA